ncbi:hypothetical protein FZC84_21200 [Rossellomorea vietnamensis]|uniref:Uncharacterized protein n=1 Tax=Rossellomorea vietnamensis TaxID=218284 RepID=A0A5D4M2B5_9BACI|nr:hypothetical protein [Rossellomorea vietnamensis]TYR95712.1 hypothetical protein FZC84_21200 [Rossellomorea vietnamensis]
MIIWNSHVEGTGELKVDYMPDNPGEHYYSFKTSRPYWIVNFQMKGKWFHSMVIKENGEFRAVYFDAFDNRGRELINLNPKTTLEDVSGEMIAAVESYIKQQEEQEPETKEEVHEEKTNVPMLSRLLQVVSSKAKTE